MKLWIKRKRDYGIAKQSNSSDVEWSWIDSYTARMLGLPELPENTLNPKEIYINDGSWRLDNPPEQKDWLAEALRHLIWLRDHNQSQTSDWTQMAVAVEQAIASRKNLSGGFQAVCQRCSELRDERDKLQADATNSLDLAYQDKTKLQAECEKLRETVKGLRAELFEKKRSLADVCAVSGKARDRAFALEGELTEARSLLGEDRAKITALEAEITWYSQELRERGKKMESAQLACERVSMALFKANERIAELQARPGVTVDQMLHLRGLCDFLVDPNNVLTSPGIRLAVCQGWAEDVRAAIAALESRVVVNCEPRPLSHPVAADQGTGSQTQPVAMDAPSTEAVCQKCGCEMTGDFDPTQGGFLRCENCGLRVGIVSTEAAPPHSEIPEGDEEAKP